MSSNRNNYKEVKEQDFFKTLLGEINTLICKLKYTKLYQSNMQNYSEINFNLWIRNTSRYKNNKAS